MLDRYEFNLGRAAQRMPTKQAPHRIDSHDSTYKRQKCKWVFRSFYLIQVNARRSVRYMCIIFLLIKYYSFMFSLEHISISSVYSSLVLDLHAFGPILLWLLV
jgi:hypothetical protein